MKTTHPNGKKTYSVTRRWMPWRRRIKDVDLPDSGFVPDLAGLGDDPISLVLLVIFGLIALIFFLPGVLLLLGFAIEVALLVALLPIAVLARTLFGVAWEVEVRERTGVIWPVVHVEPVQGWNASGARILELAQEIEHGRFTPITPAERGTVTITRDHLHPEETLRGDDPVRTFTLVLSGRDPRLSDLVSALEKRGPIVGTLRDTPTAWMLREGSATGPRGRSLAAVNSHSGYNSSVVRLAADPTSRIARGAAFHLDRLLHNEADSVLDMERHRNGFTG